MFKRTRVCYDLVCGDPKGCGRTILILLGAVIALVGGMLAYAIVGVFETITGKDYLNGKSKQSVQVEKEEA